MYEATGHGQRVARLDKLRDVTKVKEQYYTQGNAYSRLESLVEEEQWRCIFLKIIPRNHAIIVGTRGRR